MNVQWGQVPASSVLPFFFHTFNSSGASVTISNFAVGDILVYKGTSMTQRASTNGFTLLDTDGIDLDGTTGIQGFSIDLSDNSDAGFYAAGSFYTVVVGPITINANTVNFVAGTFRIGPAENTAGTPVVDVGRVAGTAQTAGDLAAMITVVDDYVDTEVAAIKAKTDLIPGTQDGKTYAQTVLLMAAALAGKASGMGTTTGVFRAIDDSKDRITATIDANGNRTAVTLDAT